MSGAAQGRVITFYSYKGGVGRTMAMANVAWIIASNGKRVLAVDWDLESPGLHKFFHPFLEDSIINATPGVIEIINDFVSNAVSPDSRDDNWYAEYARVQRHAVSLDWDFPEGGTLDFLSAGQQNREYSAAVCSLDWDNLYDRLNGGQFIRALRDDMRQNYDYALIDSRTGLSDVADICTIELPDVLTVCFTLSGQSIEGAANVARQISKRYASRKIRVLPLPMRIESDQNEQRKLTFGRNLAHKRFSGFPAGLTDKAATQYWASVEVPYKPSYAFEEILATFGDDPGLPTSLLSAYERITHWVTNGEIGSMRPMKEDARREYLDAFDREKESARRHVYLSYVANDHHWAACIQAILTDAGFSVIRRNADMTASDARTGRRGDGELQDASRVMVILSASYMNSAEGRSVWEALSTADERSARRLVPVRVKDVAVSGPFADCPMVDLAGLAVDQAADKLIRELTLLRF